MIDERKLEERLVALEAAKSWSPRVVSRLEMLLRSGTDEALYRINPIQFATEKSIAEAEGIDLFLHASVVGLFDMDWLLVCPMCSDVVESFRSLRKLHTHFHCDLCQCDYDAALDDYIKVTFTVSPAVRSIRFHKPDALSAWDYVFHSKLMPPKARFSDRISEATLIFFIRSQRGRVERHPKCGSHSTAANAWPPQQTSHPARSCSKFAMLASCRWCSASYSFRRRRFSARSFASRHPCRASDC